MLVLPLILALIVSLKHSDTARWSSIRRRCHLMLTDAQFAELMAGTRNGDQEAARQSVRECEPAIRSRLTAEELVIADRRGDGQSWEEISHELKESAESLRKCLERALQRVREELNTDQ